MCIFIVIFQVHFTKCFQVLSHYKLYYSLQAPRMFEQRECNLISDATVQNPLKTKSCFIRLLRDKEVEERIRKKYKKNDTEVNE